MPITLTGAPRPCRWVAVVTLALGLVAMHHLVGTHAYPGNSPGSSTGMTMLMSAVDNDGNGFGGVAVVPARPGTDGGLMSYLGGDPDRVVLLTGLSSAWWLAAAMSQAVRWWTG
jgi:hypothetical protein